MIYTTFKEDRLSLLGFGCMRLPTKENGSINEELLSSMVDVAIAGGINYFDTAYPYHEGFSELAIGRALSKYPRASFYLANKYPGHQHLKEHHPKELFEEQLQKCGVEYFDYYLLHNVCENSRDTYLSEDLHLLEYFLEEQKKGRIRHLGFSSHGRLDFLEEYLKYAAPHMEFCQIQVNYLDWTLQFAKEKVDLLNRYGIPVWVMEPVRGGRLCRLNDEEQAIFNSFAKGQTPANLGFRFVEQIPGVQMILSGMSNLEMLEENLSIFENKCPLSSVEEKGLFRLAEQMKKGVPCTACGYCKAGCPQGLDIPNLMQAYNDLQFSTKAMAAPMYLEQLKAGCKPSDCLACGACTQICPQQIEIPKVMKALADLMPTLPSWVEICHEREAQAEKLKKGSNK